MNPQQMSAANFKAHCLAVMDEVQRTGHEIVVTKRGRPVVRVVPLAEHAAPDLRASVLYESEDAWEPRDHGWFTTGWPEE